LRNIPCHCKGFKTFHSYRFDDKTSNIAKLQTAHSDYELELEYGVIGSGKPDKKHLMTMYGTCVSLLKVIQQSSFLVTNTISNNLIEYYKQILGIDGQLNGLYARQAVSLEIQHVTELLPNKYAVTDKDGERSQLIIHDLAVYVFIEFKCFEHWVYPSKSAHYNGSLLDGEYIYIPLTTIHVLIFDCILCGNQDMRNMFN
jgi:hypothetical protein